MQTQITRQCVIEKENWSAPHKNLSAALQDEMIH